MSSDPNEIFEPFRVPEVTHYLGFANPITRDIANHMVETGKPDFISEPRFRAMRKQIETNGTDGLVN